MNKIVNNWIWLAVSMVGLACISPLLAQGPIAGPNVNIVSTDRFLQRQNEPSVAVSSRNAQHVVSFSNDYRTVDLSITDANNKRVVGDAWLGVFKSFDGGQTWTSSLLPGCRYGTATCGPNVLNGQTYEAGADPVVRAGSNGLFYLSAIAFDRDNNRSVYFITRYIDDNNKENGDPIRYLDTRIVDVGNTGQFVDKPWIAVDIPRPGAPNCTIPASGSTPAQTFAAGTIYAGWSVFTETSSKIYVSKSTDCGVTWSKPERISEATEDSQGVSLAIDPRNGDLYAAWRRVATGTQLDSILIAKLPRTSDKFSKGELISNIIKFDLGNSATPPGFRTSTFPSITVDANGRVYAVWAQRQSVNGDARIMLSSSTNGTTWSVPVMVENPGTLFDNSALSPLALNPGRGHQLMPSITTAGGKLAITYYSLYENQTTGELRCPPTPVLCNSIDDMFEYRKATGALSPAPANAAQLATAFGSVIQDGTTAGGVPLTVRHTMDVRMALADIGAAPAFTHTRVSQYPFGSPRSAGQSVKPIKQLRYNAPNLPLFVQGTTPFMGDYIDVNAQTIVPGATAGTWAFNNSTAIKPVFHAAWTDNRDVRPPADGNWTNYKPILPTTFGPAGTCSPGQGGMRNQNVYTSRITQGMLVSVPGNNKRLGLQPRGFSIVVQNNTANIRRYRLTIMNQPPGGAASFRQTGTLLTVLEAAAAPRSSISREVFATSSVPTSQIRVDVQDITAIIGGQQTTALLNPDLTNPDLTNPDLTNPDLTNISITNAELQVPDLTNPALTNPDLTNPDLTNPDLTNPDLTNPDLTNPDLTNPDLTNPDLTNPGLANPDLTNPNIANPDLTNPDLTNPALTNPDLTNQSLIDVTWGIVNKGNTTSTFNIKLVSPLGPKSVPENAKTQLILSRIYKTPAPEWTSSVSNTCNVIDLKQTVLVANILSPVFLSPASPDLTNPDLTNPDLTNPTMTLGPGEEGRVTLRVYAPTRAAAVKFATTAVQPVPVAPAPVVIAGPPPPVVPPAVALSITSLAAPQAQLGAAYSLQLTAVGGVGTRTWTVISGTLPTGLTLNPATGLLSGTPTAAGSFTFRVNVAAPGPPAEDDAQPLTILVTALPAFIVPAQTLPSAGLGTPYSFVPTYSGGTAPLSWTYYGTLPPGLTANTATGAITGTVPNNVANVGTYTGYFAVTDSSVPQQSALLPVSLSVVSISMSFTLQPVNGVAGVNFPATVHVQDATGAPLAGIPVTLSAEPNPSGGTLSGFAVLFTGPSGDATFGAVQLNRGGWGYKLRATAPGAGSAVSNAFHVVGFGTVSPTVNPRRNHTATLLGNGDVLVAGGFINLLGSDVAVPNAELLRVSATGTAAVVAGGMAMARGHHTAALLPDGRVLIAGGEGSVVLATTEIYNPIGGFSSGPNMAIARRFHASATLPNGKVLVAGGVDGSGNPQNTTEIYDPAANLFTPGPVMCQAMDGLTATLLGNGRVLLAGGGTGFCASLYDFATNTMSTVGPMSATRRLHTATRLADGRVLLAGGNTTTGPVSALSSADVFDPVSNTFTATPSMSVARSAHDAVLLPDGYVLIASAGSAELFDPALNFFPASGQGLLVNSRLGLKLTMTGAGVVVASGGHVGTLVHNNVELYYPTNPPFQAAAWTPTGSMATDHTWAQQVLLGDGRVLVAGGRNVPGGSADLATAEVYNPTTGTWSSAGSMSTARVYYTATRLPNGKVLAAGGYFGIASADLWDPATGTWTPTGALNIGRSQHNAVLLKNGKVLIVSGAGPGGPGEPVAELYDPVTGTFSVTGSMSQGRAFAASVLLANGKVLTAGGYNPTTGASINTAEIYDPATGTWSSTGSMTKGRNAPAATLLVDGRVLVSGGSPTGLGASFDGEIWDPATGTFGPLVPLADGRGHHTGVLLPSGKVLLASSGTISGGSAEMFDPATNTSTAQPLMSTGRSAPVIVLLGNGKVLAAGGGLPSAELFSAPR